MRVFVIIGIWLVVGMVIGFWVGVFATWKNFRAGKLKVVDAKEEGIYMYLELNKEPDIVKNEKYILLKVDTLNPPSIRE